MSLSSQHYIWEYRCRHFEIFINGLKAGDFGEGFAEQRRSVVELCAKYAAFETFAAHCTRANLHILCDFLKWVVGRGSDDDFADWTYIVTQFHLFVLEAEHALHGPQHEGLPPRKMMKNTADLLAELASG